MVLSTSFPIPSNPLEHTDIVVTHISRIIHSFLVDFHQTASFTETPSWTAILWNYCSQQLHYSATATSSISSSSSSYSSLLTSRKLCEHSLLLLSDLTALPLPSSPSTPYLQIVRTLTQEALSLSSSLPSLFLSLQTPSAYFAYLLNTKQTVVEAVAMARTEENADAIRRMSEPASIALLRACREYAMLFRGDAAIWVVKMIYWYFLLEPKAFGSQDGGEGKDEDGVISLAADILISVLPEVLSTKEFNLVITLLPHFPMIPAVIRLMKALAEILPDRFLTLQTIAYFWKAIIRPESCLQMTALSSISHLISLYNHSSNTMPGELFTPTGWQFERCLLVYQQSLMSGRSEESMIAAQCYVELVEEVVKGENNMMNLWRMIGLLSKPLMGDAPLLAFDMSCEEGENIVDDNNRIDDDDDEVRSLTNFSEVDGDGDEQQTTNRHQKKVVKQSEEEWIWQVGTLFGISKIGTIIGNGGKLYGI